MSDDLPTTRCLLCSLQCPLALSSDASGGISVEYVADDQVTEGRLCFRGHYAADLAAHPMRLTSAEMRNGEPLPTQSPSFMEDVLRRLGGRLHSAGMNAAVVVDGNLTTGDILACLRFGRGALKTDRVAVYLPESDEAMLAGLRPDAELLPVEEVRNGDVFLFVGDALATHPMIGRHVMDAKWGNRAKIFGMDCLPNRVAGFADKFLLVEPGGEAPALAAVCRMAEGSLAADQAWAGEDLADLVKASGAEESMLRGIAEALAEAKQAGIFLAPAPGRMTNVTAAAAAACALCETFKAAKLMPLFRYGNAVGAGRAATAAEAQVSGEVMRAALEGRVEVLLSIGVDVLRLLSPKDAEALRRRVSTLAIASVLRNRTTEQADFVLPLAAWFEQSGQAHDAIAGTVELHSLLEPPGAALPACDLSARLAAAAHALPPSHAALPDEKPFRGAAVKEIRVGEAPDSGLRLVARTDVADFGDGSETRQCSWARYMEAEPELVVNAAEAKKRKLAPRCRAVVRANHTEARVRIRTTQQMPAGTVAVSTAFDRTRRLFLQRLDGAGIGELAPVECDVTVEADL